MEPIEYPATVGVGVGLGSNNPHREAFDLALSNILSTDIAKETYLQIVDGIPTAAVLAIRPAIYIPGKHPIFTDHRALCVGVEERLEEIRDKELDIEQIRIQSKLIGRYLSAAPGSRAFNTALVELCAVAVHGIACEIYKLGSRFHEANDPLLVWQRREPDLASCWKHTQPTFLYHPWYYDKDQYPDGVADMVGYWAEASIFGGVVLFDRLKICPELEDEDDSIWLHPSQQNVTYRICKLTGDQKMTLVSFLTSSSPEVSAIPIIPDDANDIRRDPEEALEWTGIYRDSWERRERPPGSFDQRLRDVVSAADYPKRSDLRESRNRAWEKEHAYQMRLRQERGIEEFKFDDVPPSPDIPEGTGYPDTNHSLPF